MRKIKNFRINFRQREVLRLLKKTTQITEVTPQLEEAISQESQRLAKLITPAAIYETLQKEKLAQELSVSPPGNWVAASLYLITISNTIEEEIKEAQRRGEHILGHILHALSLEALEQSTNFVERLLEDEAKQETCDLSDRVPVAATEAWAKFFEVLPGEKIGVQLLDNGSLQPLFSSGGVMYWTPSKKQRSSR